MTTPALTNLLSHVKKAILDAEAAPPDPRTDPKGVAALAVVKDLGDRLEKAIKVENPEKPAEVKPAEHPVPIPAGGTIRT